MQDSLTVFKIIGAVSLVVVAILIVAIAIEKQHENPPKNVPGNFDAGLSATCDTTVFTDSTEIVLFASNESDHFVNAIVSVDLMQKGSVIGSQDVSTRFPPHAQGYFLEETATIPNEFDPEINPPSCIVRAVTPN